MTITKKVILILSFLFFVCSTHEQPKTIYQSSTGFKLRKTNNQCPLAEYGVIQATIANNWIFHIKKIIASISFYPCVPNQKIKKSAYIKMYMSYVPNSLYKKVLKNVFKLRKKEVGFTDKQLDIIFSFIDMLKSSFWYQQEILLEQDNTHVTIKHLDKYGKVVTSGGVKMEFKKEMDIDLIQMFYKTFRIEYTRGKKLIDYKE